MFPDREKSDSHTGWLFILIAGILSLAAVTASAAPSAGAPAEYDIKAAFLYRFLFFIQWPANTETDETKAPVVIGIVGQDPFGNAFDEIDKKPIGPGKRIVQVIRFGTYQPSLDLSNCDLLFVSQTEREHVTAILERLANSPVLVVADHPGFIEAGGMINLVLQNRLVRWEINRSAIMRAGLQPQAQLLRNAIRVLETRTDGP